MNYTSRLCGSDTAGIPPIVFCHREPRPSPHSAFVQHSDREGPGWITLHISSQETPPQEPVRPRQGKHVAEKEKAGVPKEHTERDSDDSKSSILCWGDFKNDCSEKSRRRRPDCLDGLIARPVDFIHRTRFCQKARKESGLLLPGIGNKTCYAMTASHELDEVPP